MTESSLIGAGHGTDRLVQPVSKSVTERSAVFENLMRAVRLRLRGQKVAEQLAAVMGCEPRTAARYLAGDRVPGGHETFALLLHPTLGPSAMAAVMAEAERRFSPENFKRFELEMVKATVRAAVRDDIE